MNAARYAVDDIQHVLDLVSTVAHEEASKIHGVPELAGMTLMIQGISPEGLDLDALPDSLLEDLDAVTVRVLIRWPSGRFLGWETSCVLGMDDAFVVKRARDAARATFKDAICLHHVL